MADPRHEFGQTGEKHAEKFLKKLGLKTITRRFRTPVGELDLVMRDHDTVVFVEVKTRRDRRFAEPEDSIDAGKKRRLTNAARWFLNKKGWHERPCRFDVVTVILADDEPPQITHFPDAFVPGGK